MFFICKKPLEKFEESRVDFYMGNVTFPRNVRYGDIDVGNLYLIDENVLHDQLDNSEGAKYNYFSEIKLYYSILRKKYPFMDPRFVFLPGDVGHSRNDIPTITKTRPINGKGLNILLPLNIPRHWDSVRECIKLDKLEFRNKLPIIFWRGVSTGVSKRIDLVEKWRNYPGGNIDIAFTKFNDSYKGSRDPVYLGEYKSMEEQLRYKYLVSVEGNDVASNLKWIMVSNSVCLMPPPTIESWMMESKLKPWVHYVPLKPDFSDLLEKYNYCENNQELMEQIVENSKEFMKQFDFDSNKETELAVEVLRRCCELTNIYF